MDKKTWRDIEEAALNEPILYQAVTLVQRGDFTQMEALIAVTLGLVEMKKQQHEQIMDLLNTRTWPHIIFPAR